MSQAVKLVHLRVLIFQDVFCRYYKRRILRIVPAYYGMLILLHLCVLPLSSLLTPEEAWCALQSQSEWRDLLEEGTGNFLQ